MNTKAGHLSYCTNIHSGEDWRSHFTEIMSHLPWIKNHVCPNKKMGIGLRINYQMAEDLLKGNTLNSFQSWLEENDFYVFTINGFPYGQFHDTVIKDQVHSPDWTTQKRLNYTLRLFDILVRLLPDEIVNGGISTSPLSYRHWHPSEKEKSEAIEASTRHIIQVAEYLHELCDQNDKSLHLDIEPEPDGLIENGEEFIRWYEQVLIPTAQKQLNVRGFNDLESEEMIRRHIQLCYDVCHIAVGFEDQTKLTNQLNQKNISIGKIQLSSALRLPTGHSPEVFRTFAEPQYLHQVVIEKPDGTLKKFKDLPDAFNSKKVNDGEWRVHFHVPVFTENYESLSSTQNYIKEILDIHRKTPLTDHFEIETYTWDVLPADLQLSIGDSIVREVKYIKGIL